MPNEIKTFTFEDHALTFERRGEDWWANGDEAAEALGYEDKRSVADLYRRHAKEFIDGETCVLTLPPPAIGGKLPPRGRARSVRVYSPRGLEHLAILGRTETCIRFRRWVLDVIETLHNGGTLDRLHELEATVRAVVAENSALRASMIEERKILMGAITGLAETSRSCASLASQIMHERKTAKAIEADANDHKQLKLWKPLDEIEADRKKLDGDAGAVAS